MKTIFCDICKKGIEDPVAEWNYHHIREYDVCDPCKEKLDAKLRPLVRDHFPYSYEWHQDQIVNAIKKTASTSK